ncbi:MAG: EAL domain-containing protein [Candidatus Coproplasma sp.]
MKNLLLELNLQPGVAIFLVILVTVIFVVATFFLIRGIKNERNRALAEKYRIKELDRESFAQMVSYEYTSANEDTHFTVMLIKITDSENLKTTLGEKQFNRIVSTVKERLVHVIPHGSKICTYDNDRIAVFIEEDMDAIGLTNLATMSINEAKKPVVLLTRAKIDIHVNAGIASNDEFNQSADEILQNIEIALANAISAGVDKYSIYSEELAVRQSEEYRHYKEIKEAIANQQFTLYYQPIYDLKANRVIAYESLVRWNHPTLGVLPPDKFLPIMEQTGDINWIGSWAFDRMLKLQSAHIKAHPEDENLIFSMNLSPKQLMYPHLAEEFRKIYKNYRIPPQNICLEIVEFAIFDKIPEVSSNIVKLTQMGFKIAIDDFGLEMSSLKLLENIDFNWIKLARKFIEQAQDDFLIGGVVETLVGFSKQKNCKIVAEGVEDEIILKYVKGLNIHYGQGYYFGKPLPYEEYLA